MAEQLLSSTWYRVAGLRPRLRSHVRIHRHEYRGARWYVVEDRISRRSHRFTPTAYYVLGLMDGRRSMDTIWQAAVKRFGDDVPPQDEVIQLLGQLHSAELMQSEVTPDVDELLMRHQRQARRTFIGKLLSPLAIRIPLIDPDRFLARFLHWYQPLFGSVGLILWIAVVGWGSITAIQHWGDLSEDLTNRVLAPQNLLILGLVFPVLKALHEFGHACAVKAWGGEVHEMGIMFLVLMPIPYVDASAANAFPEKRRRLLVGAAGMVVELFVASIALFFWLEMQPGIPRAILFNVMLIAGVSTVLFNANPLLRFDGYYILADLIEIPNLRQRATQYLGSLFQRRLFGLEVTPPDASLRERAWLLFFAVASFVYRIFITLVIAVFVASQYLFIGVLLAIWAILSAMVLPLIGLVAYVGWNPRLRRHRTRAIATSMVLAAALFVLTFVVQVPSWTNAQGVIQIPEQSVVRGGTDGFVTRVLALPGSGVRPDQPLIEMTDPVLPARIRHLDARKAELEARYQSELSENVVRAQLTREQLNSVDAELRRAHERQGELLVRSPADGLFTVFTPQDLPGRFVKQGEQIGYVIPLESLTARVVVPQQHVNLVRSHTARVEVKLAERVSETLQGQILREVPRASDRLPSMALSQAGGGEVALDPKGGEMPKTLQTHFEFEIELPATRSTGFGGRVYVRFEHGKESVAKQVWRWMRQLFLQRLAV